eukprot:6193751-Pleurochrysis_carterae.AAC.1
MAAYEYPYPISRPLLFAVCSLGPMSGPPELNYAREQSFGLHVVVRRTSAIFVAMDIRHSSDDCCPTDYDTGSCQLAAVTTLCRKGGLPMLSQATGS